MASRPLQKPCAWTSRTDGEASDKRKRYRRAGHSPEVCPDWQPGWRATTNRGPVAGTVLRDGGSVDNLGSQPHLPWQVFEETVKVISQQGGTALRGNAMGF